MVSDGPINLNKARKARARVDGDVQAARNRVVHGLTKAEKVAADVVRRRDERRLDQRRLEP